LDFAQKSNFATEPKNVVDQFSKDRPSCPLQFFGVGAVFSARTYHGLSEARRKAFILGRAIDAGNFD